MISLLLSLSAGAGPTPQQEAEVLRRQVLLQDRVHPRTQSFDEDIWSDLGKAVLDKEEVVHHRAVLLGTHLLRYWVIPPKEAAALDKRVAKLEDRGEGSWATEDLRWGLQLVVTEPAARAELALPRLSSNDPVKQKYACDLLLVEGGTEAIAVLEKASATLRSRGRHADAAYQEVALTRLHLAAELAPLDDLGRASRLKSAIDELRGQDDLGDNELAVLGWMIRELGARSDERVPGWLRGLVASDLEPAALAAQASMMWRGELSRPAIEVRH